MTPNLNGCFLILSQNNDQAEQKLFTWGTMVVSETYAQPLAICDQLRSADFGPANQILMRCRPIIGLKSFSLKD